MSTLSARQATIAKRRALQKLGQQTLDCLNNPEHVRGNPLVRLAEYATACEMTLARIEKERDQ